MYEYKRYYPTWSFIIKVNSQNLIAVLDNLSICLNIENVHSIILLPEVIGVPDERMGEEICAWIK